MKLLDLAVPGWLKLVAGGLVALCFAWIFFAVKGWHDDSEALPGVKRELADAQAETEQVRRDWSVESARLAKVTEGLANENETLRQQRAAVPVRAVRLCRAAGEGTAGKANPAGTGRGDEAAAGSGALSPETGQGLAAGPDIGPQLYAIADEADDLLRRYRGAQAYIAGLPDSCLATPH